MALEKGWVTKQIDFSNAFVQAPINRNVFVALPPWFDDTSGIESKALCLKLKKSLYGLKEAPKLWGDFLAGALERQGFEATSQDPAVFLGNGMTIAVYVDDVLFYGPDESKMEEVITNLQSKGFQLKREKAGDDSAYDFLGISIQELGDYIKLSQHGLIKKFLANCNAKQTPCSKTPLGTDANGPRHCEKWEYASAVGMLMYLVGNAHPEIQFAVHQCARFTHSPRKSHKQAVKRIAHYLKGILDKDQGLMFKKTDDLTLDCFVDTDFARLWTYNDAQDPVCVWS